MRKRMDAVWWERRGKGKHVVGETWRGQKEQVLRGVRVEEEEVWGKGVGLTGVREEAEMLGEGESLTGKGEKLKLVMMQAAAWCGSCGMRGFDVGMGIDLRSAQSVQSLRLSKR